jgi:predicted GNAT family acetyltransferase
VPPTITALFDEVVKRIRISQRRVVPQMVLEQAEDEEVVEIPSTPLGFKILPVRTVREMRTWTYVTKEGFGMGRQNVFRPLLNAKSLESYKMVMFIGLASNKPVATSCCLVSEGVTGIFGISTIPKARGRGYGEAMTWETVRYGRSRGSRLFSLQASPMGYPIYHRMGFRRIYDLEEWVVPRDAPDVKRLYCDRRTS